MERKYRPLTTHDQHIAYFSHYENNINSLTRKCFPSQCFQIDSVNLVSLVILLSSSRLNRKDVSQSKRFDILPLPQLADSSETDFLKVSTFNLEQIIILLISSNNKHICRSLLIYEHRCITIDPWLYVYQ